jgi:AcrR family transcriptional regulator
MDMDREGDRIIDAALSLAAREGWQGLSLGDIAKEARLPLSAIYSRFGGKAAILDAFVHRVDRAVLAGPAPDRDGSARDRLFEVLMRRFDALTPHKKGLLAIARDVSRDPVSWLCGSQALSRSMAWMLEAARIEGGGPWGPFRVNGLALIYLNAFRTWLRDDSADMARTMAALDRGLRQAESLFRFCGRMRRPGTRDEQPARPSRPIRKAQAKSRPRSRRK